MSCETTYAPIQRIEDLIFLVRGQRVMLDSHLARIYGVTTGRLNQAVKRNAGRFNDGFAFQLAPQEFAALISQSVISKSGRGGRTKAPWVFTEHGALMLGMVLNSNTAVQASVRVVKVFIAMREQLTAHKELAGKLAELEDRLGGHDAAVQNLFEAIRQLVEPPLPENRRSIGFHIRECGTSYRAKTILKSRR